MGKFHYIVNIERITRGVAHRNGALYLNSTLRILGITKGPFLQECGVPKVTPIGFYTLANRTDGIIKSRGR